MVPVPKTIDIVPGNGTVTQSNETAGKASSYVSSFSDLGRPPIPSKFPERMATQPSKASIPATLFVSLPAGIHTMLVRFARRRGRSPTCDIRCFFTGS